LHNGEMLNQISTDFPDWYVTVSFYVAVHCMEACLTEVNRHSKTHVERASNLRRAYGGTATFSSMGVFRAYLLLFDLSIDARYECIHLGDADCRDADRALAIVERYADWRLGSGSSSSSRP